MSTARRAVLVITSKTDATATYLLDQCAARGILFTRLDTESIPSYWKIDWVIRPFSMAILTAAETVIDLGCIGSVWYRRPLPPRVAKEVTEPAARTFAQAEYEETLVSLWQTLDALWVSPPWAIRYASHKPHQLRLAAKLGLSVPDTLVSTNPATIRDFWEKHGRSVVFKTLHQDPIEIAGQNYFAYTQRLMEEQLSDPAQFSLSPTLYQMYIAPMLEIRATVIGDTLFAASLQTKGYPPDWRRLSPDEQRWQRHSLPHEIEARCVELVRQYGLSFGAIDLIQDCSGEYFFLELNPNGQWAWLEMVTGMPMSEAMIALLSGDV